MGDKKDPRLIVGSLLAFAASLPQRRGCEMAGCPNYIPGWRGTCSLDCMVDAAEEADGFDINNEHGG